MVPGKSFSIICRTGHVWQPIGRPSGLARNSSAPAGSTPAATTPFAVLLRNSLLVIAPICSPRPPRYTKRKEKMEIENGGFGPFDAGAIMERLCDRVSESDQKRYSTPNSQGAMGASFLCRELVGNGRTIL